VKILIVDDSALIRTTLRAAFVKRSSLPGKRDRVTIAGVFYGECQFPERTLRCLFFTTPVSRGFRNPSDRRGNECACATNLHKRRSFHPWPPHSLHSRLACLSSPLYYPASSALSVIFVHALGREVAELRGNTSQQRLKIPGHTGREINSPCLQAEEGKFGLPDRYPSCLIMAQP